MCFNRYSTIFFFQAEDGIRDGRVTGVQTCALPICARAGAPPSGRHPARGDPAGQAPPGAPTRRSEEASCRERVEISVVVVSLKKKKTLFPALRSRMQRSEVEDDEALSSTEAQKFPQ